MTFPFPVIAPGKYVPGAVNFDGTNDYLTRGAGLTGAADSKLISGAFWINPGSLAVAQRIFTSHDTLAGGAATLVFRATLLTTGAIAFVGENSAGTIILNYENSDNLLSTGQWYSVMFAVDLANTSNRFIYINDTAATLTVTTYTDDTMDFTNADWAVGGDAAGGNKYTGDLAELYVNTGTFINWSTTATRRLYRSSAGKPVNIGATGSSITGSQPIIYLGGHKSGNGATSVWHTNRGSGGGFTVTGALSSSSTNPST